jgi:multiple sugar transport system permease protein
MDGAGALRRFTDVTLPTLVPTFVLVGILTVSGYFQLFAEPYVMTQGGPLRSTFSMLYLMYEEAFAGGTSATPRRWRSCSSS